MLSDIFVCYTIAHDIVSNGSLHVRITRVWTEAVLVVNNNCRCTRTVGLQIIIIEYTTYYDRISRLGAPACKPVRVRCVHV